MVHGTVQVENTETSIPIKVDFIERTEVKWIVLS